jgi:hypothetical protein
MLPVRERQVDFRMPQLPPGPIFLLGLIPNLTLPPAIIWGLLKAISKYYGSSVPIWITAMACVSSIPALALGRDIVQEFLTERHAATLGAIKPTSINRGSHTGFDLIKKFQQDMLQGYPGVCRAIILDKISQ